MTEQDIRRIAQQTGYTILESPIWEQLAKRFIEELLHEIDKEKSHV